MPISYFFAGKQVDSEFSIELKQKEVVPLFFSLLGSYIENTVNLSIMADVLYFLIVVKPQLLN